MFHFDHDAFIIVWRESVRRRLNLGPSSSVFGKSPNGHRMDYLTIGSERTVKIMRNRKDSIYTHLEATLSRKS